LRTSFPNTPIGTFQDINPHSAEIPLEDLSALGPEAARRESWERAVVFAQQPMNLERGPLLRAVLYRWSATGHWLAVIFHQMIFDGASMRVFNRELGECYSAFVAGREPALEPLPVTYADFSRWQLDSAKQTEDSAAFWRKRLEKPYQPLRLSADMVPPGSGITPAAHAAVRFPKLVMDGLKDLAHETGATSFAAFLASFQAYLACATKQFDVLAFASIAARTHSALRNVIGLIANVLPLRLDLAGNPSFREALGRSGEMVASALSHQTLPLSEILQCLSIDPPGASVLQMLVIYNNAPLQRLKLPGVTFTPSIELDNGAAKFDVALDVADSPQGLSGFLKYRSDLYTRETIDQLVEGWLSFTCAVIAEPDKPLGSIETKGLKPGPALATIEQPLAGIGATRPAAGGLTGARETAYAPPETELQKKLSVIWATVFGIKSAGINDSFFSLGGHSLTAVKLTAAIEKETGKKLRLCTIFQQPTIARLAKALEDANTRVEHSIVEIQPHGSKPPLFLVHGVGGGMFWGYNNLARELGPEQPVYGFKSRGLDGLEEFTTIEEIAAQYVSDLLKFQPAGPYYLGGYCFGGNVAYEMARQLRAQNRAVGLLLLINCWSNNSSYMRVRPSPGVAWRALANFTIRLQHQVRAGLQNPRAFFKWRAAWIARRFKALIARDARERLSVEDIVNMSSQSEEEKKLWRTHVQAWLKYVPQSYQGRVALFRTRGHPLVCSFDPKMGWGDLATGGVDVHVCRGDHESILEEENVGEVANRLKQVIANVAVKAPANESLSHSTEVSLSRAAVTPFQTEAIAVASSSPSIA
jgi:thioesterase domain-containing protein/acyl carrier protein